MRKFIVILLLVCMGSFAYGEDLIDEYIDLTQEDLLTEESYNLRKADINNEGLEKFLEGHFLVKKYAYAESYSVLEEALELSKNPKLSREILYYLGMLDLTFDDTPSAITRGLELKKKSHEENDIKSIIRSNQILAIGYFGTYDFEQGKSYAEEALSLSMTLDDHEGIWRYYMFMGNLSIYEDAYEAGLDYYDQALAHYKDTKFRTIFEDVYPTTERHIAYALYWNNRKYEARGRLIDALEYVDPEDYLLKARIYYQLGWPTNNNRLEARDYLEKGLEAYSKVSRRNTYDVLSNDLHQYLAFNYYATGDYQIAAEYFYKVSDYYNSEEYFEATRDAFLDLNTYKYNEVQEKMILLEDLAKSKDEALQAQRQLLIFLVMGIVSLILLIVILYLLVRVRKNSKKALYLSSITDDLTTIYNRSHILKILNNKLEGDNAVLLLDLDDFSEINKIYGYHVGDEVLKKIAESLSHSVRGEDVVGRYGGEEFLIILEHASQEDCRLIAERIRKSIASIIWNRTDMKVTCSVGATRMYSKNADDILKRASSLVEEAKENGKNQVAYG